MSSWEIVGIRKNGEHETIYEGEDYSNVSDMMVESESRYSRIEAYQNGRLDQTINCSPARGFDLSWVFFIIIVVVILGSLLVAR